MAEDIPFDRSMQFEHGRVDWLTPRLRRLIARNPGPFTFTGTNSYIVGVGRVAVIDPGPDDPAHLAALTRALSGETVEAVIVTHTHRDHSSLARRLAEIVGAPMLAQGPHRAARELGEDEALQLEASCDLDFVPDRRLADGEAVEGPGWTLETVLTPGHTMNHAAFAFREENALLSGDHVMAWATPVIAPPDGAMGPYMASLRKLAAREESVFWPGHGGPVGNARAFTGAYIKHRLMREAAILSRIEAGVSTIPELVAQIYVGLDPRLVSAAGRSVLAHLEDLAERGAVAADPAVTSNARYRKA